MEYEYATQRFDPEETVEIPDEAVGVSIDETNAGRDDPYDWQVRVRYLIPVEVDA